MELARLVQRGLEARGFYAARHSSSILVMWRGRVIGSVHILGDECVVSPSPVLGPEEAEAFGLLRRVVEELCGSGALRLPG